MSPGFLFGLALMAAVSVVIGCLVFFAPFSTDAWDRQLVETCNPVQMVHRWKDGRLVLSQLRCVTRERSALPVGETKK